MTDIMAASLSPSPDAVESAVGDETVILHLKSGVYFGLDPMGTRIWAMLKEGTSSAGICKRLADEFGVSEKIVEGDARRFLSDLKANDIVIDG